MSAARERLKTPSRRGTVSGRTPRAFAVDSSKSGMIATKRRSFLISCLTYHTFFPSKTAVTSPPVSAGVELSGCPSIPAARFSSSSSETGFPIRRFAPLSPAITQAELEPSPRVSGMLLIWPILSPRKGTPHSS